MDIKMENISGTVYLGTEAGTEIMEKIKAAKSNVWIITPYIDMETINMLLGKEKGVNLKIFINAGQIEKAINKNSKISGWIEENTSNNHNYLKFIICTFLICLLIGIGALLPIIAILGKIKIYTILTALPLFFISYLLYKKTNKIKYYNYSYSTKVPIYFIKSIRKDSNSKNNDNGYNYDNIHSKVYFIDDTVYIGSLNFTKKSFEYNIETWFKSDDENLVKNIKEYMMELQNSHEWIDNIPQFAYRLSRENENQKKSKKINKNPREDKEKMR